MKYVTYLRGPWDVDGEIDHGFTGGLHGAGCYVLDDPVFGELAYGGRLERTAEGWRVIPWDGVRRYLAFPRKNRFEMRLVTNGFSKGKPVTVAEDFSRLSFTVEPRGARAHPASCCF